MYLDFELFADCQLLTVPAVPSIHPLPGNVAKKSLDGLLVDFRAKSLICMYKVELKISSIIMELYAIPQNVTYGTFLKR